MLKYWSAGRKTLESVVCCFLLISYVYLVHPKAAFQFDTFAAAAKKRVFWEFEVMAANPRQCLYKVGSQISDCARSGEISQWLELLYIHWQTSLSLLLRQTEDETEHILTFDHLHAGSSNKATLAKLAAGIYQDPKRVSSKKQDSLSVFLLFNKPLQRIGKQSNKMLEFVCQLLSIQRKTRGVEIHPKTWNITLAMPEYSIALGKT